ncbi:hypothetical protein D3C86_2139650 [compost metagenome]
MQRGFGVWRFLVKEAADFFKLACRHLAMAKIVDGLALTSLHQPGARIAGNAGIRPTAQCRHQRFLRQLFGQ